MLPILLWPSQRRARSIHALSRALYGYAGHGMAEGLRVCKFCWNARQRAVVLHELVDPSPAHVEYRHGFDRLDERLEGRFLIQQRLGVLGETTIAEADVGLDQRQPGFTRIPEEKILSNHLCL